MNQIAELSQVEQLQTVSSSSEISEAAGLIGQSVTGNDTSGTLITGTVTGVTNGTERTDARHRRRCHGSFRSGADRRSDELTVGAPSPHTPRITTDQRLPDRR